MEGQQNNIDVFHEAVARILGQLWNQHPIPFAFDFEGMKVAFPGIDAEEKEIYTNTVHWLAQEGFITLESEDVIIRGYRAGTRYGGSTLTLKGISLLGQMVSVGSSGDSGEKKSFGSEMLSNIGSGLYSVAGTLAREALLAWGRSAMGIG